MAHLNVHLTPHTIDEESPPRHPALHNVMPRRLSLRFANDDETLTGVHEHEVKRPLKFFLDRIRDYLVERGVDCGKICKRSFYGWEMSAKLHGRTFRFVMQYVEDWRVDVEQEGLFNFVTARRPLDECLDEIGAHVLAWASSMGSNVTNARIADD